MSLISLDLPARASDHGPTSKPDRHDMSDVSHSLDSSLREKVLEHLFVGELLRCLWCRGVRDIEVLRCEVDRAGYDLVLEANDVLRHVQFKASFNGAKTSKVSVHTALAAKQSGCVIWIRFDPETLALGPFLWFGGAPNEPLPPLGDKITKHTRSNSRQEKSLRPDVRDLNKGRFTALANIEDVVKRLFGA